MTLKFVHANHYSTCILRLSILKLQKTKIKKIYIFLFTAYLKYYKTIKSYNKKKKKAERHNWKVAKKKKKKKKKT